MKDMKKGMSLITLVITITLMIIIATVSIVNLSNSNVIKEAENATNSFNLKSVEQLANMAYANIYFDNLTQGIRRELTPDEIRTRILKDGADENIVNKFNIEIINGDIKVSIKEVEK